MSAHWSATTGQATTDVPLGRIGLFALLSATARRHPERVAFIDPADKPAWSGRPAITWTYAAATEIVERLARGLGAWRLPPGSRIGLCLPGSAENALALLAVEAAGHIACPLPVAWDEDRLVAAIESAGIGALLTQSRLGPAALAERACRVAVRCFGLRYVAAFGPEIPDGVINLDEMVLDNRAPAGPRPFPLGIVSFVGGDPDRPIHRACGALVAAAAAHLVALRPAPGERILSLLGPNDLRGLATGLAAALVAGTSLETLPVFDGPALAAALARPIPTHLVAPAFLEHRITGRDLPENLRSVTIVHRAPAIVPSRTGTVDGSPVQAASLIDAMTFDETALLSGRRGGGGDLASVLANPARLALPSTLLAMRREPDGCLAFRGQACATAPLARETPEPSRPDMWRRTTYEPALLAGSAFGVALHNAESAESAQNYFATA